MMMHEADAFIRDMSAAHATLEMDGRSYAARAMGVEIARVAVDKDSHGIIQAFRRLPPLETIRVPFTVVRD